MSSCPKLKTKRLKEANCIGLPGLPGCASDVSICTGFVLVTAAREVVSSDGRNHFCVSP